MKILHAVGTRPNFIKVAPVMRALNKAGNFEQILVHVGQHTGPDMADSIFKDLELRPSDVFIKASNDSIPSMMADIMPAFLSLLQSTKPDWLFVYGDVTATVACAITAAHTSVKIAHIESGLRSFDRTMPEEINRIVTDHVSTLLFASCDGAERQLISEGIPTESIHTVGNVMIDSLVYVMPKAKEIQIDPHILVTLHRPSNVDDSGKLAQIVETLDTISERSGLDIIFPVHPRTEKKIGRTRMVRLVRPLGYIDCISHILSARLVITDSGGIQEETAFLKVPCLTVRENTERPITMTMGTNKLVGTNPQTLIENAMFQLEHGPNISSEIPLWDGHSAERVVKVITEMR